MSSSPTLLPTPQVRTLISIANELSKAIDNILGLRERLPTRFTSRFTSHLRHTSQAGRRMGAIPLRHLLPHEVDSPDPRHLAHRTDLPRRVTRPLPAPSQSTSQSTSHRGCPPVTLAHPTITIADLQALLAANPSQAIPAQVIDMGRGSTPYRLVWLRQPDGSQALYRLVPEASPPQTPAPAA